MTKRSSLMLFAIVAVLLIISGCKKTPTPTISPLFSPATSPLLPEATPVAEQPVIPTAAPGLGNVTGVLIHNVFETPIENVTVYIAPVLTSEDQKMEMAKFDKSTATGTQTDENGRFFFQDITPGRYAIILGGVIDDYLVADFRTQEEVVFNLESDQVVDLGEIWIVPPEDVTS